MVAHNPSPNAVGMEPVLAICLQKHPMIQTYHANLLPINLFLNLFPFLLNHYFFEFDFGGLKVFGCEIGECSIIYFILVCLGLLFVGATFVLFAHAAAKNN